MTPLHTPGPWHAQARTVYSSERRALAVVWSNGFTGGAAEADANLNLIAAAPELLAALRGLVEAVQAHDACGVFDTSPCLTDARLAIGLATRWSAA